MLFSCPFCSPAISFTQQINMDPPQLTTSWFPACFGISPLHLNLFLYRSTFYGEIYPIHLLPHPSSVLTISRHYVSRIFPRTHCSSKYCITVPEKHDLFLSAHLTTFVSSYLSRNSNGKRLNGSYSGIYSLFFIKLVYKPMLCHY